MRQVNDLFNAVDNNQHIKSKGRDYLIIKTLGVGDVADVYLTQAEKKYVVKVSRVKGGDSLLDVEQKFLTQINAKTYPAPIGYYFPRLIESFPVRDTFSKRVNVFEYDSELVPLTEVYKKYPGNIDPRHIGWIFRRLLAILALNQQFDGPIHGAILPCHASN